MDNGEAHETGQVEMVSDDVMKIFLEACFHNHVFPVMLLLKHVESHFYGVQHGNLFFEWHAQPGPDMRSRLDSVHEATGFPKLPSVGYDLDSVRAEVTLDEQFVLEDLGVDLYANGSQDGGLSHPTALDSINRKLSPASAHVHSEVYARVFRYDDMSQMGAIDARTAGRLHSVNENVFAEWAQTEGSIMGCLLYRIGQGLRLILLEWQFLLHPHGKFTDPEPYLQQLWTPNLMMITVKTADIMVVFVNIYAPTARRDREALYTLLRKVPFVATENLLVGGNYNCTQHTMADRSNNTAASNHSSPGLSKCLQQLNLTDSLQLTLPHPGDDDGQTSFQHTQHRYTYTLPGKETAYSRIDRWFHSDALRMWVVSTSVPLDDLESDHKGVLLELRDSKNPIKVHKPPQVYPVPSYVRTQTREYIVGKLTLFAADM
ncbi:unnamed protein product [Peronospora effusa]|nr:unnamed protein product [Peronospora effusa]